jgi:hypothetical protein
MNWDKLLEKIAKEWLAPMREQADRNLLLLEAGTPRDTLAQAIDIRFDCMVRDFKRRLLPLLEAGQAMCEKVDNYWELMGTEELKRWREAKQRAEEG